MPHISDRADKFAKGLSKKPPVDERTTDEKVAALAKKYSPTDAIKKARQRLERMKQRNA